MKFGVVVFPGSNCDHDMVYAIDKLLEHEVVKLWHKERDLQNCDIIILPGGFSYGDYLRSGAIARFSPIMETVIEFAQQGGYVFGICNGFQVLCESGLLPGALLHNDNQKFICSNVYIKSETQDSLINSDVELGKPLKIPVAHGEGRYFADAETLKQLNDNDQVLYRYCDDKGEANATGNPNGSVENIAGICNKERNVFGMMPHPERASDPELGNIDGKQLLTSILRAVPA